MARSGSGADDDLQPIVDAGSKSTDTGVASQRRMLRDAPDAARAAGPGDVVANSNLGTASVQLELARAAANLLP
ncbi:hypothetical protein GCM10023322_15300 [Rugosimonospora acidiphila]|uniref:Uncharacterized protein n=1 Tax=Rugosimonospora acidiphila TaxID=556531 RepID=A0ABP9RMD1_9ACTN